MPTTPASYGFGTRQTSTRRRRDRFGAARPGAQTSTRSMYSQAAQPAPPLGNFAYSGEPGYVPQAASPQASGGFGTLGTLANAAMALYGPQGRQGMFQALTGDPNFGVADAAGRLGNAALGLAGPYPRQGFAQGLAGGSPFTAPPGANQPAGAGPAPAEPQSFASIPTQQQPLTPPMSPQQPYAPPAVQQQPAAPQMEAYQQIQQLRQQQAERVGALQAQRMEEARQRLAASIQDPRVAAAGARTSFGFDPVEGASQPSVPRAMGSGPAAYEMAMGNANQFAMMGPSAEDVARQQFGQRQQDVMDAAAANGGLYTPLQNTPPVVRGGNVVPGQPSPFGTQVVQGQFGPRLVGAPRTDTERAEYFADQQARTATTRRRQGQVEEFRRERMEEGQRRLAERFGRTPSQQQASQFGTRATQRVNIQNTTANNAGTTAGQAATQGGATAIESQQAKAQGVADEVFRQMQDENRDRYEIIEALEKLNDDYPEGVQTPVELFMTMLFNEQRRQQKRREQGPFGGLSRALITD